MRMITAWAWGTSKKSNPLSAKCASCCYMYRNCNGNGNEPTMEKRKSIFEKKKRKRKQVIVRIPCIFLQLNGICLRDKVWMCTKRLNPSIEITLLLSNLQNIVVDCNFIENIVNENYFNENSHHSNVMALEVSFVAILIVLHCEYTRLIWKFQQNQISIFFSFFSLFSY